VVTINKINSIQARIIRELLTDGRKSDKEIAAKMGLKVASVRRNIADLESGGVITGATTHINYKLFGYKAVAYVFINVETDQSVLLSEYLRKMPEVYSVVEGGAKGSLRVIVILQSLEQLNEFKDRVRRSFSVFEIKTAIWTDVKEMNENLTIVPENWKKIDSSLPKVGEKSGVDGLVFEDMDLKIADKLTEDGRMSFDKIGLELGVSGRIVKRRYERLKRCGFLKVTIQVDPHKLGYQALCTLFMVTLHEDPYLIIDRIKNIPDVISIMKTTGDYDLQVFAMLRSLEQLLFVKEAVEAVPGVSKVDMDLSKFGESWIKWPTPKQYISTF
jgi:DNA-binding Lrp family transcriptional regulator